MTDPLPTRSLPAAPVRSARAGAGRDPGRAPAGVRKVLVIGSGPIIIGQAAEFDYSGTQACRALKEEGLEVVLLNSNPATVMTDPGTADRIYVEPLTAEFAEAVIRRERPDALLPTLGGQVGLNLAMELVRAGVLERYGVQLLGTPPEAIQRAEDREAFKELMLAIGEPVPQSTIVRSYEEALAFARRVGFPVIARPGYTLGGTGGGIARNEVELAALVDRGLAASPIGQVLLEESLLGWKEIEFEVIRDGAGNAIAICSMENVDPVGVHTGDSIVVAPALTLTDRQLQRLRSASLRIVGAIGVEGGCNVQLALRPDGAEYRVIEVNPRVSRSSALASKATGYPIAKVAARVALGRRLDEIRNPITGTSALFEPALDYVVVKIPRWPFDKFATADRRLGTQMKATGEVMAIDRSFEGALLKAVRSLEIGVDALEWPEARQLDEQALEAAIREGDDRRLFLLAEALRRGRSVEELHAWTGIDRFFLHRIARVVALEERLRDAGRRAGPAAAPGTGDAPVPPDLLLEAKRLGLTDRRIAELTGSTEEAVRQARRAAGLRPGYKMVDTCAAEFEALTPYFYSTHGEADEAGERRAADGDRPVVVVLGAGPIRISQGIEFDYSAVHAVRTLRALGYRAVIVNNNPETVSTDFDTADRLYFEPLTPEDVRNVLDLEQPVGVLAQFGGQTAVNLVAPLAAAGVPILGTAPESVDVAESRERFDQLLARLGLQRPPGAAARSVAEAMAAAERIGYPVIVRPSYVLGGRAMQVASSPEELAAYLETAARVAGDRPVWIDRYIAGMELEVDAVADGETVVIPAVMRHIERAGVHSGDSIAVVPAPGVPAAVLAQVEAATVALARALEVRGVINLQFVWDGRTLYVLEVNPRASRTVPFITKATGVPLAELATRAALGQRLAGLGWRTGLLPPPEHVAVKLPVFSWNKLPGVDPSLGPEMQSTGEVMGIDVTLEGALARGLLAAGMKLPEPGQGVLLTVADPDKPAAVELARRLAAAGYRLYATPGTAAALAAAGLEATVLPKLSAAAPDEPAPGPSRTPLLDALRDGRVRLVINTLTQGRDPQRDGFRIRRAAVERGIPCLTSLDTAAALVEVLMHRPDRRALAAQVRALQDLKPVAAGGSRPGAGAPGATAGHGPAVAGGGAGGGAHRDGRSGHQVPGTVQAFPAGRERR
ncbi:carbamoyl-phosphate synthase large subunit [Thermaerobacter subterraneus]|uniref:Carbamoyl phosphate synthase large chain n=1 Tax=Thermaerobacter subterraneus DSM 13965 TaxID=867903 RepID=K6Q283_9FIRM|nr:carbamoyl-phosphate synthase, large subunit [Thermaerobacter subterraneus DSM 13965]